MKKLFFLFLYLSTFSCSAPSEPDQILLLGHSHLYTNDLPAIFCQIASGHKKSVSVESFAQSNWSISNHVQSDKSQNLIASRHWDHILVMGHTMEMIDDDRIEKDFYQNMRMIHNRTEETNSPLVLFQNWAFKNGIPYDGIDTYDRMQNKIKESCETIAGELNINIAPAGEAWAKAALSFPDIPLWISDNKHAFPEGTALAAYVIFKTMYPGIKLKRVHINGIDDRVIEEIILVTKSVVSGQ